MAKNFVSGGMVGPEYLTMTLRQLCRAVSRLLFSPLGVSGDGALLTALNSGVGQCVAMPNSRARSDLLEAMLAQLPAVAGDTAADTEMRGWLSDLCDWGAESGYMNPVTAMGGGGVRAILHGDNYRLGRIYHDMTP